MEGARVKPHGEKTGFVESFGHALSGIVQAFATGRNFKVQLAFACAIVLCGLLLSFKPWEWCIIICCCALVLGMECVNSAIESTVDLACNHVDPRAKAAKDLAAGAVLICSIASALVGIILILSHLP